MSAEMAEVKSLPTSMDVDCCGETNQDDEPLDPRVGPELERLNAAAEAVNKYEVELTQRKVEMNKRMQEIVMQLKEIAEHVGTGRIEQAREYYELLEQSDIVKQQLCEASMAYKSAANRCEVAKEMLRIAEQSFLERATSDTSSAHLDYTYQEMLNHATETVVHAETERSECDQKVRELTSRTAEIEHRQNLIRRQHPRSIERTAPYFEFRTRIDIEVKERRRRCEETALRLRRAKTEYRSALRRLDEISKEIHIRRTELRTNTEQLQSQTQSADVDRDQRPITPGVADGSGTNTDTNISQGSSDQRHTRPSAIQTAMQNARDLVESATRNRKLLSSSTVVPNSPNLDLDSQSSGHRSVTEANKPDEPMTEKASDDQDEPDAFERETEQGGTCSASSPIPLASTSASTSASVNSWTIPTTPGDATDTHSDSSSLASLLLDVAFEKLVLGDASERPRAPAADSLSAASRSSSYEHAIANADQAQSLLVVGSRPPDDGTNSNTMEDCTVESKPVTDSVTTPEFTDVRRSASASSGASMSTSSLSASDRSNLFAKRLTATAISNDPLRAPPVAQESSGIAETDSDSGSDFEAIETTV